MLSRAFQNLIKVGFCSAKQISPPKKYSELVNCSRTVMDLYDLIFRNEGAIFVAPNATIVGEVFLGNQIVVGHGTVIRGDINRVMLTKNIVIGNNCVLHTAASSPTGLAAEIYLWGDTVIQHNCVLYSCVLEEQVYIGHNSVIMQGAIIKKGAIIAPNSVVPPGRIVKQRQIWGGNPIKFIRNAQQQEGFVSLDFARHVNKAMVSYTQSFLPYSNAYLYRTGETQPLQKYVVDVNPYERYEKEMCYNPGQATINKY